MVLLIGFYSGITNITSVIAVAGANVAMILFGWLQERMNPPGRTRTTMLPFWFGAIVGIAPWIAIAVQIFGSETVPGFVYGIVIVQFVLFFSFGLNQSLQYRRRRQMGRLSLRREGLSRAQPRGEVTARLADLLPEPRLLSSIPNRLPKGITPRSPPPGVEVGEGDAG